MPMEAKKGLAPARKGGAAADPPRRSLAPARARARAPRSAPTEFALTNIPQRLHVALDEGIALKLGRGAEHDVRNTHGVPVQDQPEGDDGEGVEARSWGLTIARVVRAHRGAVDEARDEWRAATCGGMNDVANTGGGAPRAGVQGRCCAVKLHAPSLAMMTEFERV